MSEATFNEALHVFVCVCVCVCVYALACACVYCAVQARALKHRYTQTQTQKHKYDRNTQRTLNTAHKTLCKRHQHLGVDVMIAYKLSNYLFQFNSAQYHRVQKVAKQEGKRDDRADKSS